MAEPWNLSPAEWASALKHHLSPEAVAKELKESSYFPWNSVLLRYTCDSDRILDLGSGRGEHSALLAMEGKQATLFDWSQDNLDFSKQLFEALGKKGDYIKGDMTQRLPFDDNTFDTVFSCGVFEYFTDEMIIQILQEAFRISKKRVIIMVPNALSVAYRVGMACMKKNKQWQWGGERPFTTLKPQFMAASKAIRFTEFSVGTKHSLTFLTMRGGKFFQKLITRTFKLADHAQPSRFHQGYLLISIAEKVRQA